jgi:rare lipoprotein A
MQFIFCRMKIFNIRLNLLVLVFYSFTVIASEPLITADSGKASYYHNSFHGQETSNGEKYDKHDFTAAHRSLPFNTLVLVTNKANGKSVVVRINDRGPFKRSRVIDLSYAAAKKIGMVSFGIVPVRLTVLNYFDQYQCSDSALTANSTWNCFGQQQMLSKKSIFIWKTDNVKHAFYMASILALEHANDSIVVRVNASSGKKIYSLFITAINSSESVNRLLAILKKSGFQNAELINHSS